MFYNTIKLSGSDLQIARDTTKSQEEFIKWIFNNENSLKVTPSQMLQLFGKNVPITSIRRALTNLTNDNFLEKTDEQISGLYGKPEHMWKIKNQKQITNKFF